MKTQSRAHTSGFTVIELIVVIIILFAAAGLFFYQKNSLQTASLDERRKTAINSIYYNLEEVYYPKNGFYPAELTSSNLSAVAPELLVDTNGNKIDDKLDLSELDEDLQEQLKDSPAGLSEYVYEPLNCNAAGECKGYTLRVALANESDYIKKSRRN